MTQIKQEPFDYDDVPENKILTRIEITDPLDIKLEPVLDEKFEDDLELSETKIGTDIDLDKIDVIPTDEVLYDSEKEEFSDTKTDDKSEDEDFEMPDEDFALQGI